MIYPADLRAKAGKKAEKRQHGRMAYSGFMLAPDIRASRLTPNAANFHDGRASWVRHRQAIPGTEH